MLLSGDWDSWCVWEFCVLRARFHLTIISAKVGDTFNIENSFAGRVTSNLVAFSSTKKGKGVAVTTRTVFLKEPERCETRFNTKELCFLKNQEWRRSQCGMSSVVKADKVGKPSTFLETLTLWMATNYKSEGYCIGTLRSVYENQ